MGTGITSESRYARSLIEASLDPLVTFNTKGKIMDMNEALVNITGFTRKKLKDTDFFDYFTEPEKAREVYTQVFAKRSITNSALTFRQKNGKLTDVLFNGSVYKDDSGKVLGAVLMARDITEQKWAMELRIANKELAFQNDEKEKRAEELIIANKELVFQNDEKEKRASELIIANEELAFQSREKEKRAAELIIADKELVYQNEEKEKRAAELIIADKELDYQNEEKEKRAAELIIADKELAFQNQEKEKRESANKELEAFSRIAEEAKIRAENATRIAENAVKSKQQFLSNMSHEIRTPMNSIIGFTKVLLRTELTPKQKEYLTAIKMSGDTLIGLINDILDLAKVDAGKMIFEQIPFRMALSISAMLQLFEVKAQEKNLKLIKKYDDRIPKVLLGDPVRLHQVILNLVSNAIKFTNKGEIVVGVNMISEDEETVNIEFSVTDTGIGIAEDKIEKIFENFQQASSGTSRLYGGTGLGLAIVKQLVEPQGGTINVKSNIKDGSTFSFILPFKKTQTEIEIVEESIELNPEITNVKVLVAEDIALNQLLMKTLLDDFGFECDIADNGEIAIEKLKTKSYDIILMDLQMPSMNGFEATEYIRNHLKSDIPIIALTADVTTVDLAKCKSVGMNDYIAKPADERILYSKIVGLIKKKSIVNGDKKDGTGLTINLKCTDLDYLKRCTKSNSALMMEMINLYLEQTPPLVSKMKQSLNDKDWDLLASVIHKMIPSFVIMGIHKDFENMAKKIQEYARTQEHLDELPELAGHIDRVCTQACEELHRIV